MRLEFVRFQLLLSRERRNVRQIVVGRLEERRLKEVPEVGLEPTRPCGHWILSPARLPFRHSGRVVSNF